MQESGTTIVTNGAVKLLSSDPHPLVYPIPNDQPKVYHHQLLLSLLQTVTVLHHAPYPIQSVQTWLWVQAVSLTALRVHLICRVAMTFQNKFIVQWSHRRLCVSSRILKTGARHWVALWRPMHCDPVGTHSDCLCQVEKEWTGERQHAAVYGTYLLL